MPLPRKIQTRCPAYLSLTCTLRPSIQSFFFSSDFFFSPLSCALLPIFLFSAIFRFLFYYLHPSPVRLWTSTANVTVGHCVVAEDSFAISLGERRQQAAFCAALLLLILAQPCTCWCEGVRFREMWLSSDSLFPSLNL